MTSVHQPYPAKAYEWDGRVWDSVVEIRDLLLGIRPSMIRFRRLEPDTLAEMIRRGFVAEVGDHCPPVAAFLAFMQSEPGITAFGFATRCNEEHAYESVVIEGVALHADGCIDPRVFRAFVRFAQANQADELRLEDGGLVAFWD